MLKGSGQQKRRVQAGFLVRFLFFVLFALLFLAGCSQGDTGERFIDSEKPAPSSPVESFRESAPPAESESAVSEADQPQTQPQTPAYTKEAKLIAVGDIMMHRPQSVSGYDKEQKSYSFDTFFQEVRPYLSSGDWVVGNLETPLADPATGFTGYPLFNAPAELADALKEAGFTVITNANNHALDRGEQGVLQTLKNIRSRGLYTEGTASSEAEANEPLIITQNGISMAILAYSYGTNGIPIPKDKPYLISLIDPDQIADDIAAARSKGADIVTVSLHFGVEYQRQPNAEQKQLAQQLVKAGADIILGSHPHVVQPYEIIQTQDENGAEKKGVVIYSLGNFISNQTGNYKDVGVMFAVTIRKRFPDGKAEIAEIETTPTWVNRYYIKNKRQYRVLPLARFLTERDDPILGQTDYPAMQTYLDEMNVHLESLIESVDQR